MTTENHDDDGIRRPEARAQAQRAAKRPYQKPAFRRERIFETRALTCGKINTTQSQCAHNKKNS
jgi:hypothetical protein